MPEARSVRRWWRIFVGWWFGYDCYVCHERCEFLREYVMADHICYCCRALLAELEPCSWTTTADHLGCWTSTGFRL